MENQTPRGQARPAGETLSFSSLAAKKRGPAPARGADARPPTAPKSYSGVTRTFVLVLVLLTTVVGLIIGGSWLTYRYRHVVIQDATVKGRVARIGARIDGQVIQVEAQPGQRVARGEVLVRLQDQHLQAAVRRAQTGLQSASRRYQSERLAIDQERRRLELEVERCESVYRSAAGELESNVSLHESLGKEHDRISTLVVTGAVSASEMDKIQGDRNSARAVVKTHEANLATAEVRCRAARVEIEGLKVREASLEVMASEVEAARDGVAAAEADLAATVIRAPDDGWVIERIVEPGGSAKVGEPMISMWVGQPWIEAWADEDKLSRIGIGSTVDVSIAALPDEKFTGRVEGFGVLTDKEIPATAVPSSLHSFFPKKAMVPIRIGLPDGLTRLQPGLSAIVGIRRFSGATTKSAGTGDRFIATVEAPLPSLTVNNKP